MRKELSPVRPRLTKGPRLFRAKGDSTMRAYFRLAVLSAAFPALLLPVLAQNASDTGDDKADAKLRFGIYKEVAKTYKLTCKLTGKPEDGEAQELAFQVEVESKRPSPEGIKKYKENIPRVTRDYNQACGKTETPWPRRSTSSTP